MHSNDPNRLRSALRRGPLCLAGLAALLALAGCVLLKFSAGEAYLKFTHAAHAEYEDACEACHTHPDTGDIALAGHAACADCHDIDESESGDACLACHRSAAPHKRLVRPARPDYELAFFDHDPHSDLACEACHGPVGEPKLLGPEVRFPEMEDCTACHYPEVRDVRDTPCGDCHGALTVETRPEDHAASAWERTHGLVSRTQPAMCDRCHSQTADCESCHARTRPRSHTAAFRDKTHGFHAMSNPLSCETCHEQDACDSCHRTTEPRNHTGSFKRYPYFHCASCHLPLEDENRCSVCHDTGEPHANIQRLKPYVNPHPFNTIEAGQCEPCH